MIEENKSKSTYDTSDIIKEISLETNKPAKEIKQIIDLFIKKLREKCLTQKVFINRLGSFKSFVIIKRGFNNLAKCGRGNINSKYVTSKLKDGGFITQKPKIKFTPSESFLEDVWKNNKSN